MSTEIQQIIVYRNPIEAAIWNSMSSNPDVILYIIIWMPLTILIVALMFNLFPRFATRNRRNSTPQLIVLGVGCLISAVFTYGILNFALI